MFEDEFRAGHEADSHEVIETIFRVASGELKDRELREYIRRRDRRLRLEVDSSQLNYFLLDHLVDLYPQARFLLTIRNPYAWVDSFINHQLGRSASETWKKFRDFRFRPGEFDHPPEEAALQERGLYTLDGYFSYWSRHNERVLGTVPESRLLVVRTPEITERATEIATFVGVSPEKINRDRSHSNTAKTKFHVLDDVDRDHLARKVDEHCGTLMQKYFPDVRRPVEGLPSLSREK